MGGFRAKMAQFFYGRNGPDRITTVLTWISLPLAIVGIFARGVVGYVFWGLYVLCLGYIFFRMLSRNVYARQKEEQAFVRFFSKIGNFFRLQKRKLTDKDHVYRKCPSCGSQLRLPKKKGKHSVRCPRCRGEFQVKI